MGKRFKLRISRVIPSFQSCRSKHPSTFPHHPTVISQPFLRRHSTTAVTPPPSSTTKHHHHHRSSFKSHVSSAFTGCGFGSATFSSDTSTDNFQWLQEDDHWHVVAKVNDHDESPRRKIYNSSADNSDDGIWPLPLPLPLQTQVQERKKRRGGKTKTSSAAARSKISTANLGEDETETLVSSDSSTDFDPQLEIIRSKSKSKSKKSKKTKSKEEETVRRRSSTEYCASPARLSVVAKLMRRVEGKVKGSFAVVKKSSDPYEDFKGSMMEMIVEKEMFEEKDLEQLLQCFLSLNSRYHHAVIIEAFTEIWDTIFFNSMADDRSKPS